MDQFEPDRDFVPSARLAPAEGIHVGIIWEVAEDGLTILFERGFGRCYASNIPTGIDWTNLTIETRVEVCISGMFTSNKPSLTLLRILGECSGEIRLEEHLHRRPLRRKSRFTSAVRSAASGALSGDNLNYTRAIKVALDEGVANINDLGKRPNKLPACRNGLVAEADHVATYNTDAVFTRSGNRAHRLDSKKKCSVDVIVTNSKCKVINEVSSKVCRTVQWSTGGQAKRGYGDQDRLVPKDQLKQVQEMAAAKATKEAAKPEALHQNKAADYAKVADKATDTVKGNGNRSQARNYKESQDLGEKAANGDVVSGDIVGPASLRMRQGAMQGARSGAIGGATFSAVSEGVGAVRNYNRGERSAGEAVGDFAIGVAQGTAEGAVKGAVSGAATAGARVLAEKVTSTAAKRVLGGAAPAAAAIATVEITAAAIQFARGVKTGVEFRSSVLNSVGSAGGGMGGAAIGIAVGGPIGAVIGGLLGSIFGGQISALFSHSDPRMALLESAAVLRPGPTVDGAFQYRLQQLALLIAALDQKTSFIYPGRVLRMPNDYQLTADVMLAYRGTIWAIDFKAWKGVLSLPEGSEMQGFDPRWLVKTRTDKQGKLVVQHLRNPIQDLRRFALAAQRHLAKQDRRWCNYTIKPIVVVPNGCIKTGLMVHDSRFVELDEFLRLLSVYGDSTTEDWMPDDLMSVPTWDVIQGRNDVIRQGLIAGGFDMQLDDGATHIPYEAIIKLEIGEQVGDYRRATATFRQQEVLEAFLPQQPVLLNHKGREESFSLHDMKLVCPANMLLSS